MPIPSPKKDEEQKNFISRCMGNPVMVKEYPDQKQRAAICYSQYKRRKKAKEAKGDFSEPDWCECEKEHLVVLL